MKKIKEFIKYTLIIVISGLTALNYKIFVFPNSFAPAGVDGICTMFQHITNTNMGYLSLVVNIPIMIFGFFTVNKSFIAKSIIYTISFSVFVVLLDYIDMSNIIFYTETGTSIVLAPIASGVFRGLLYAATLGLGGSAGGVDVIAAIIRYYKPHYSLMNIIFALNAFIAMAAYYVYGFNLEPVICSIIFSYITSNVAKAVATNLKENIKFEIVTENSDELCEKISNQLGLSSTIINAQGGYSGKSKKMIICIVDKESAPKLEQILKTFPESISFESTIVSSEKIKKY